MENQKPKLTITIARLTYMLNEAYRLGYNKALIDDGSEDNEQIRKRRNLRVNQLVDRCIRND